MDLNETIVFESNAIYGASAFDPFILTGTTEVTNTISLASNWNWISFNVYQDDMSLANVFSSIAIANDEIDNVELISNEGGQLTVKLPQDADSNAFLRYLLDHQIHIVGFKEILPTLNEIFIKVVKDPSHE